jgi:3-oxoacyl-[acyl-carrier protein] reductase
LACDGNYVAVNYAHNRAAAEDVCRAIIAAGGQAKLFPFDVTDWEAVRTNVKQITRELGKIRVLVNNAGMIRDQPLVRMVDDDWHSVLNVDLSGVYYCTKAVVKTWTGKHRGGRIISIGSIAGEMGNAYQANYAAAKAGIIGFTKSLARELAAKAATVNVVSPGFITTDGTAHLQEDELRAQIPLGRFGTPEEVAHAVSFLASDLAAYITGHVIRVNGGLYM